jgi:hypothetical protein
MTGRDLLFELLQALLPGGVVAPGPDAQNAGVSHELDSPSVEMASPPLRPSPRERPSLSPGIQHLEHRSLFAGNVTNGIVEYATTSPGSNPVGAVQGGAMAISG